MPALLGPGWHSYNPYCSAGKFSNKPAILLWFNCILNLKKYIFLKNQRHLLKMCSVFGDLKFCTYFSAQDWQWHRSIYRKSRSQKLWTVSEKSLSLPSLLFFCEILLPKRKRVLLPSYFWLPPLSVMSTNYRKWAIIFLCMLYCLHGGDLCLQRPKHRWKWQIIWPYSNQALNLDWSERTTIHRNQT